MQITTKNFKKHKTFTTKEHLIKKLKNNKGEIITNILENIYNAILHVNDVQKQCKLTAKTLLSR